VLEDSDESEYIYNRAGSGGIDHDDDEEEEEEEEVKEAGDGDGEAAKTGIGRKRKRLSTEGRAETSTRRSPMEGGQVSNLEKARRSAAAVCSPTAASAPRENDVLMGRGRGLSGHPGNVLFRQFIREKREEYSSSWK